MRGGRTAIERAAEDRSLPTLTAALDHAAAQPALADALDLPDLCLLRISVVRHRPGESCLVRYDGMTPGDELAVHVLGKVTAKDDGTHPLNVVSGFWRSGFDTASSDAISVARPRGRVAAFDMWLRDYIPGAPIGALLALPGADVLARRLGQAAAKLHASPQKAVRQYGVDHVMGDLGLRLGTLAASRPALAGLIERALRDAECVVGRLPPPAVLTGIHGDFRPGRVLLTDGGRLFVVGFGRYANGDPAMDVGHCLARMTEQALCERGAPDAFESLEEALVHSYQRHAPQASREAILGYAALLLLLRADAAARRDDDESAEVLLEFALRRLNRTHRHV